MDRFNTKELEKIIPFLIVRDGNICKIFGLRLENLKTKVNVHHRNGDQDDLRTENLELNCHKCNVLAARNKRIQIIEKQMNAPIELQLGTIMEAKFCSWLYGYLLTHHFITWGEARDTGAAEADCSIETIRKYLFKHTAELSEKVLFKIDERGHVVFKSWVKDILEEDKFLQ